MMTVYEFRDWCRNKHDVECNQKYDGNLPYSKHLEFVQAHYYMFERLLPQDISLRHNVLAGCWGHDLIEDARVTYNDIDQIVGAEVADIIYCCTEEKGRDRDERHCERYYKELATNDLAIFVKLCDIMANVTYSLLTNSSMYKKHKAEHVKTITYLYRDRYMEMFSYLGKLFEMR